MSAIASNGQVRANEQIGSTRMRLLIAASAAVAVQAAGAAAQQLPGDPAAGLDYARAICAGCHDVEREWDELAAFYGPPFVDIAAMPSTTEMSLKVFLRTPHENMPNLILSDEDRDNVVSYILSLKPE
jgi:mono/diheme cytochrome c family protein